MHTKNSAYLLLAVAAALFGMTFVAVKDALEWLPPLAFVGWRFLVGAIVLLAWKFPRGRSIWIDGGIAGALLFCGYAAQTIGLASTSATNSGLVTGLYVVFTPLVAALVRRLRPSAPTIAGASVSVAGLWLLTAPGGLSFSAGDLWTLLCAIAFAAHIVALASMAPRHRVVPFTAVQLLVTAVLGLGLSGLLEHPPWPPSEVWPTLLATALIVTCGAFLIQVWAQSIVGPSRTAIVLALEPLFAVITAWVVLAERLTLHGSVGAVLMLAGTYVVLVFAAPEDADIRTAEALSEAH